MKNITSILIPISLGLLLNCCSVSEPDNQETGGKHEITLVASRSGDDVCTRTVRNEEDGSVLWTNGDRISFFVGKGTDGGYEFVSCEGVNSLTANFVGEIEESQSRLTDGQYYWGVYPYDTTTACDGNSVTLTLSDHQVATPESFATNLFPAIGRSTYLEMSFYNVCGGLKIRVQQENLKRITLHSNDGPIAGKARIELDNAGVPYVAEIIEGSEDIILEAPEGEFLIPGKDYYFVSFPHAFESKYFTMTFESSEQSGTYERTKPITISRSVFEYFNAAVDSGVEYHSNYQVGDYVDSDGLGVIAWVSDDRKTALLMSVAEIKNKNWEDSNAWCLSYGAGWFLPEIDQLTQISSNFSIINQSLADKGFVQLSTSNICYWSSTENPANPDYCYRERLNDGSVFNNTGNDEKKTSTENYCRAVKLLYNSSGDAPTIDDDSDYIVFEDDDVRFICVKYWDLNGDGRLSHKEAKKVTSLNDAFQYSWTVSAFTELRYFTGIERLDGFRGCRILERVTLPESTVIIGDYAFSNCTKLSSIVIPDSVVAIADSAFAGCSGLTTIAIPESVTTIGESAFAGCSGLTTVIIPNSVTTIGESAFAGCSGLTTVVIPESVTAISQSAFSKCTGLTTIVIPDSVTSIGSSSFSYCKSLQNITIPDSVTRIGDKAFYSCYKLVSIDIPDYVTYLGKDCFEFCYALSKVVLGKSLSKIPDGCFAYCETLSSIEFGDSLESIGEGAFKATGPMSVRIPDTVTSIGREAFHSSSITWIRLPDSVKELKPYVFSGCSNLKAIRLSKTLTVIPEYAFNGCTKIGGIDIPETIKTISNYAFAGCSEMYSITIRALQPPTFGSDVFDNSLTSLYVPLESIELYRNILPDYYNRIKPINGN